MTVRAGRQDGRVWIRLADWLAAAGHPDVDEVSAAGVAAMLDRPGIRAG
jgi:hypothetical protein